MVDMLNHALAYAGRGLHVFPVEYKRPIVAWRDHSTTDEDTIRTWWAAHPHAGIGLDCGRSGIVVIDVDDEQAVVELGARTGMLLDNVDTTVARTGGGGTHYYFRAPDGIEIRNSASKIAPKMDVRGEGGFVVMPPSLHENGEHYSWSVSTPPADVPAWLLEVLTEKKKTPPSPVPRTQVFSHERWGLAVLAAEAHTIESAPEGMRNNALFKGATSAFEAVKGGHLDRELATMRLIQAAHTAGLEEHEITRTMESAWDTAEARHPEDRPQPTTLVQGPAPQRHAFRVLDVEELEHMPPPTWLIQDRLPEGQTWIYGEPGTGKTFLALDWAASVAASGLTVLYCVGEGVQGFAQRVVSWRSAHRRDLSTFKVIPQVPHLVEQESMRHFAELVHDLQPKLVVIDTFARAAVGGDENSARDVGLAIDGLDMLWREHGISSLVIHHSNKHGGTERGSSAIRGAADATWEVQPGIDGDRLLGFRALCRKMKDSELPTSPLYQLRSHGESAVIYPSALT